MSQPTQQIYRSRREMLLNNLLGGIAWGLGSTIGVAIIVGVIGFIVSKLNIMPFFGDFATYINHYVQSH